jgi:chromosome segregation ATPase
MKESYINDLIAAEDREKSLRNELTQLKDCNQKQNEIIQQFTTSVEQSKQTLTTELGILTLSSRCESPVPHGTL